MLSQEKTIYPKVSHKIHRSANLYVYSIFRRFDIFMFDQPLYVYNRYDKSLC